MKAGSEPLLWHAFDQAAHSHASSVAVVDGTAEVTYRQLRERALANAAQLRATVAGNTTPAVVALVERDPVATIAWLFGALSAGATVTLIAAAEPDRTAQLRLVRPDVTITCTDTTPLTEYPRVNNGPAGTHLRLPPGMIVCTAGTTGAPKAVVHSHATLGHAVRRLQLFRLEAAGTTARVPGDTSDLADDLLDSAAAPAMGLRYATTLPLTTMAGLTVALQALLAGDCIVIPPSTDRRLLLATIATAGVTNLSLTPFVAQLVLRAARQRNAPKLQQLLFVGIGGGPVPPNLPAELEAAIDCPVAVGFGTTETGGALTMGRIADPPGVRHSSVGRALRGVGIAVDPLTQELAVSCASTAVGYLSGARSLTELDRGPWRTGDLARVRADGALELCGRADALILRGGRNIDPVRIEHVLEAHPAVRRAAVFGVANPVVAGEQDIWTAVVLDHDADENELRAHCNRSLGAALTPRRVIAVDALPLTADGAVRRHELTGFAGRRSLARTGRT